MDLLALFQWFESTWAGAIVRESIWMFPVIQCFHLLSLGLMGGLVLVVDLRALGWGLRSPSLAALATRLNPWLWGSLAILILSGVLMFLSEAIKCYYSPPFWYKMAFLVLATLFTLTLRRRAFAAATDPAQRAPAIACFSLALWFSVAFAGRWIAFY